LIGKAVDVDLLDEFEKCWSGLGLDSVSTFFSLRSHLGLNLSKTWSCLGLPNTLVLILT